MIHDTDDVVATTVVEFCPGSKDPASGVMKIDLRPGYFSGDWPVRLFPPLPGGGVTVGGLLGSGSQDTVKVVASNGSITSGSVRGFDPAPEIVTFSGGRESSTSYPITGNFKYESLGLAFDEDGNEVHPSLESRDYVVKSDIEFWGAFRVTYSTEYREYFWKYEDAGIPDDLALGQIMAFYQENSVSMSLSQKELFDTNWADLYIVSSEYVSDDGSASEEVDVRHQGTWEKPPGFNNNPRDNTYPGIGVTGPSIFSFQVHDRTHQIAQVSTFGIVKKESFHRPNMQPYTLSANYKPPLIVTQSKAPENGKFDKTWGKLDYAALKLEIQSDYAGYSITFPAGW